MNEQSQAKLGQGGRRGEAYLWETRTSSFHSLGAYLMAKSCSGINSPEAQCKSTVCDRGS